MIADEQQRYEEFERRRALIRDAHLKPADARRSRRRGGCTTLR